MVKIFMAGATGHIDGSVAERLVREGHVVIDLASSAEGACELEQRSIRPVTGTLDDARTVTKAARDAAALINAAKANHPDAVQVLASALAESGIVATQSAVESVDAVYDEYSPFTPALPRVVQRAAIDQVVFDAASRRVELGRPPLGVSMLQDIEHGWYRRVHRS
jgi:uncharacterized protein YbjT (DUF2867 family)